ncbi:kinesin-like protein KIF3B [Glandiceps talaboti]
MFEVAQVFEVAEHIKMLLMKIIRYIMKLRKQKKKVNPEWIEMTELKLKKSEEVVVSRQPMNQEEIAAGHEGVIEMDINIGKPLCFIERGLYEERFRVLVDSVLEGLNGTISSYGQIGTGKTFTMEGVWSDPDLRDLIPDSFDHICTHISQSENQQYLVRASYLEIYQEKISDLLSNVQEERLELIKRPDVGVYVMNLISFVTKSVTEIKHMVNVGNQNRAVGGYWHGDVVVKLFNADTDNNLQLLPFKQEEEHAKEAKEINLSLAALDNVISARVDGKSTHIPYRDSKLTRLQQDSLGGNAKKVMVANIGPASYNYDESLTTLSGYWHGDEVVKLFNADTDNNLQLLPFKQEEEHAKEATEINLSLAALDNVISARVDGKSTHIPYRDSKLTRLQQDSLGGNAKKVMVANIGPASYNYDESLTTLRYNADSAKNIKNKPKINEDPKDVLLQEFQDEIVRPKSQLDKKRGTGQRTLEKRQNRGTAVSENRAILKLFSAEHVANED